MWMEGIRMRKSVLGVALLLGLAVVRLSAQSSSPHITVVDPANGATGDVVTATGENLGSEIVAAVYLTDGKNDIKVVVVSQTDTSLQFKIPAEIKPGRLALLVLTKGKEPKLIEEPVKLTVETRSTT
jgi:IPT/TIG domain-containing protein